MISKRPARLYRIIIDTIESRGLVTPVVLLLIFSLGVFRNIHLPGLYWDAVNPDYLAAKILAGNRYINHFPPWDAFPVLGNYYHGVMHTYFGLIFFKLFGFSVFSIRVAHAIFGFCILLAANKILARATGSRVFSLLIIAVLALDPAFIFAFRTQYYITLSPLLFLLVSFYLLLLIRNRISASDAGGRCSVLLIMSGALAGWAFYGYFIYIFFLPALLVMLVHLSRQPGYPVLKMVPLWLTGFAFGALLYFIGYGRLWLELGGLSEILKSASGLNIAGTPTEISSRPVILFIKTVLSFAGISQYNLIFSDTPITARGELKLIVMVLITLIAILVLAVRKRFTASLGYPLLLITSFFVVAMFFIGRIGPHHMIPMLPFLYMVFGISLHQAGSCFVNGLTVPARKFVPVAFIPLVLFLGILNLQQQNLFQKQLLETGGVKYYSDSLTLLAEEARHNPRPPYYVFADWGFIGSFAFLTEGKVPYSPAMDEWAIGRVPCSTDVAILFWGQENSLVESFANTQGLMKTRKVYFQRDGAVSFTALIITDRKNCSLSDTHPDY